MMICNIKVIDFTHTREIVFAHKMHKCSISFICMPNLCSLKISNRRNRGIIIGKFTSQQRAYLSILPCPTCISKYPYIIQNVGRGSFLHNRDHLYLMNGLGVKLLPIDPDPYLSAPQRQTGRSLKQRGGEHRCTIKNGVIQESALAEHVLRLDIQWTSDSLRC